MKIIFGQKNDLLQNVSFYLLFFLVGRGALIFQVTVTFQFTEM